MFVHCGVCVRNLCNAGFVSVKCVVIFCVMSGVCLRDVHCGLFMELVTCVVCVCMRCVHCGGCV